MVRDLIEKLDIFICIADFAVKANVNSILIHVKFLL